jgi:chromosomal replication initiator protein
MNTSKEILNIVSETTGITIEQILSPSRKMEIVQARHLSMYFHRWNTNLSLQQISAIHKRDQHGTVINACNAISWDIRSNQKLSDQHDHIKQYLKNS